MRAGLRAGCRRWVLLALVVWAAHAVPPAAAQTAVSTTAELFAALANTSISEIVLTGDIQVDDAPPPHVLPIRLDGRNLTIAGPAPPASPASLNLTGLWPLLAVGPGSSLTVRDLSASGVPPYGAALEAHQFPSPGTLSATSGFPVGGWSAALFPSVVLESGSQLSLVRSNFSRELDVCTPAFFRQSFSNFLSLMGNSTQLLSSNTLAVYGSRTFPLPLRAGAQQGQDAGSATLQLQGPATLTCSASGAPAAESGAGTSTSGGGLSAGAAAGIACGAAAALAAALAAAFLVFRRRGRRRRAALSVVSVHSSTTLSRAGEDPAPGAASLELLRRQHREERIGSMLRVRFGGLEGLEIGGLIGRGAFGRVYRGSLRGVTVAVKVIEHSVGSMRSGEGGSSVDPAAEALMLTSLAHPNIVSVFKCATLRVQGTAGALSGSTNAWSLPRGSPRQAPTPVDSGGGGANPFAAAGATVSGGKSQQLGQPLQVQEQVGSQVVVDEAAAPTPPPPQQQQRSEVTSIPDSPRLEGPGGMAAVVAAGLGESATASPIPSSSAEGQLAPGGATEGQLAGGRLTDRQATAGSSSEKRTGSSGGGVSGPLASTQPGQYETWMVMMYCEKGSLDRAIEKRLMWRRDGARREALVLSILTDVTEGLNYLHESNVVHGDLKPANILLKAAGKGSLRALIADFGLSKLLPGGQHSLVLTQTVGTAQYMAPELLSAGRLSRAADIYSLALIMLEAWTGAPAFPGQNMAAIFYSVVHQGHRPPRPPDMPPALAQLIERCWQQEPQDRPTVAEVLRCLREIRAAGPAVGPDAKAEDKRLGLH